MFFNNWPYGASSVSLFLIGGGIAFYNHADYVAASTCRACVVAPGAKLISPIASSFPAAGRC